MGFFPSDDDFQVTRHRDGTVSVRTNRRFMSERLFDAILYNRSEAARYEAHQSHVFGPQDCAEIALDHRAVAAQVAAIRDELGLS